MTSYPPPPPKSRRRPVRQPRARAYQERIGEPVERRPQAADPQPDVRALRAYILVVGSMAVFPTLWTDQDPRNCVISQSRQPPQERTPVRVQHPWLRLLLARHLRRPAVTVHRDRCHRGDRPHRRELGPARRLLRRLGRHHHLEDRRHLPVAALPARCDRVPHRGQVQNILTITMVLVILGWTTIARVMRGASSRRRTSTTS